MANIETPRPIRGTQDMLGEQAQRFTQVVETFERVRKLYGFNRIETPVFEATAVFSRSLGETTDVVSKEMYTFEDRGGDSLTLRPEFTAGIARAYLTEGWQQFAPLKVANHGPLFRYERPQKGRFRQFHQLDAEIIGAGEPAATARSPMQCPKSTRRCPPKRAHFLTLWPVDSTHRASNGPAIPVSFAASI